MGSLSSSRETRGLVSSSTVARALLLATSVGLAALSIGAPLPASAEQTVTTRGVPSGEQPFAVEPQRHAATSAAQQPKDFWDKLEASGAIVGGVLVAVIGAFATITYHRRQQQAADRQAAQQLLVNRVQTLGQLMPFLASSDARQVEAALVSIAELGDPELATNMAAIYRAEGGTQALERLANSTDRDAAETARATLATIFARVRDSVAWIDVNGQHRGMAVFVAPHLLATLNFVLNPSASDHVGNLRIWHAGGSDVATVKLAGQGPTGVSILASEAAGVPLPFSGSNQLSIGDAVSVAGPAESVAGAREISIVRASIDGLTEGGDLNLADIQLKPGSAGAPVIDPNGALVGMVYLSNDPKSRAGGRAIPVETIREAIRLALQDSNGGTSTASSSLTPPATPQSRSTS